MTDEESEGEGEELGTSEPVPIPQPRENPLLLGHEAAEAAMLGAFVSGRLPHAWLLSGPRGIGKATLAYRFARFLFAADGGGGLFAAPPTSLAVEPGDPIFRRVASGGMADLLVVERSVDPRRKKLRSEIVVDDTRAIAGFLRLTAAEGHRRVVVLDGADMMNRNAANALLKILEEPPEQTVLLLVSDNPGRLLPTIRSRCRSLMLKPLPGATVAGALARYRPDLSAGDRTALARIAEGSIGRALDMAAAGGLALYRTLVKLLEQLPEVDGASLHAFAERLARSDGEEAFRLTAELLLDWLARMVAMAAGAGAATRAVLPEEATTMRRLGGRGELDRWVEVWEKLARLFAFFALEDAAR